MDFSALSGATAHFYEPQGVRNRICILLQGHDVDYSRVVVIVNWTQVKPDYILYWSALPSGSDSGHHGEWRVFWK